LVWAYRPLLLQRRPEDAASGSGSGALALAGGGAAGGGADDLGGHLVRSVTTSCIT
jgi:hypothetical protein